MRLTLVGLVVGKSVGSVVVGLPVGGYDDSSNLVDETMFYNSTRDKRSMVSDLPW